MYQLAFLKEVCLIFVDNGLETLFILRWTYGVLKIPVPMHFHVKSRHLCSSTHNQQRWHFQIAAAALVRTEARRSSKRLLSFQPVKLDVPVAWLLYGSNVTLCDLSSYRKRAAEHEWAALFFSREPKKSAAQFSKKERKVSAIRKNWWAQTLFFSALYEFFLPVKL